MRLSMTLIVRDEEENLGRCIDSFIDDVDELVVVDTGSTDETMRVAREHAGAKLVEGTFEWVDDFAAARNHADSLATGDWLSWCDADDEIHGLDRLRKLAETADEQTVSFFCHYTYARDEAGNTVSELWRERLTRAGGPRWEGRLHEHKIFTEGKVIQVDPTVADWLHHHSFEDTRGDRNLRILGAWLEDEPENPRVLSSIGLEHVSANRPADAIPIYERYLACDGEPADRRCQATRYLCVMLIQEGRLQEAKQHAFRALGELWEWADTHLTLAEIAQAEGNPQEGHRHAQAALDLGKPQSLLILNPVQYTAHPLAIQAICLAQAGDYEGALEKAKAVFEIVPGYQVVAPQVDRWRMLLKHERTVGQVTALAQQLLDHGETEKAWDLLGTVPFYCQDDPRIIDARVAVRGVLDTPVERHVDPDTPFGKFLVRELEEVAA